MAHLRPIASVRTSDLEPAQGVTQIPASRMVPRRALIQENPDRLIGAGIISPFDVQDAVAETRRCVKELGFRGVFLRPNEVRGRNWHAPSYEPLWTALEELVVPLGFHEGASSGHISQAVVIPLRVSLADAVAITTWQGAKKEQPMFKYVHHVHYVVHSRDAMVDYLEKTFGMQPDQLVVYEDRGMKDALYEVGQTHIQITEPLDLNSEIGRHLATHGPGVYHVAWGVDHIQQVARDLVAKGNIMRGKDGITESPRGYLTANIDPASSHGLWFQLAEG